MWNPKTKHYKIIRTQRVNLRNTVALKHPSFAAPDLSSSQFIRTPENWGPNFPFLSGTVCNTTNAIPSAESSDERIWVTNEAEVQVGQNSFINTVSFALLRSQICRISDGKVYRTEKKCPESSEQKFPHPFSKKKKKKKKKRHVRTLFWFARSSGRVHEENMTSSGRGGSGWEEQEQERWIIK